MPCVLGHARALQALHGGKATHETIDAQKLAVRLRGGLVAPASVSPAALRAPRDLLRRRSPLVRTRAERLPPVQHTTHQDTGPAIGTDLASTTNRPGGAERCADPAVPTSVAVDLALSDSDDQRRRDLELPMVQTATAA